MCSANDVTHMPSVVSTTHSAVLSYIVDMMSYKIGYDISGEVVMTKIPWVQCLIQGCDVMREVDVTS